jgi:hypothetical protein
MECAALNNYSYDEGRLLRDISSGIASITWTPTGKVKQVTKTDNSSIVFLYDPMGNRIAKLVKDNTQFQTGVGVDQQYLGVKVSFIIGVEFGFDVGTFTKAIEGTPK